MTLFYCLFMLIFYNANSSILWVESWHCCYEVSFIIYNYTGFMTEKFIMVLSETSITVQAKESQSKRIQNITAIYESSIPRLGTNDIAGNCNIWASLQWYCNCLLFCNYNAIYSLHWSVQSYRKHVIALSLLLFVIRFHYCHFPSRCHCFQLRCSGHYPPYL